MTTWQHTGERVFPELVVLPPSRIMERVCPRVAPVTMEVERVAGGAGATESEQLAGDLDRDLAGWLGFLVPRRPDSTFSRLGSSSAASSNRPAQSRRA
jgi:hypothetical protein